MMVKVINESATKRFVLEGLGDIVVQEKSAYSFNNIDIIYPDMVLDICENSSPEEVSYAMLNKIADTKLKESIDSLTTSNEHLLNDEDANIMIDKIESIIKNGKRMVWKKDLYICGASALDKVYVCFDSLNESEMRNLASLAYLGNVCGSSPDSTKSKYYEATELVSMKPDFRRMVIKMGISHIRATAEKSITSLQDAMNLPLKQKLEWLDLRRGMSIYFISKKKID